ncbi:DUF1538 domain-containing protein [Clostridium boliviensis]|uniref:DUF1538 domain-containing protein n=1 Tax=Clostridium boliviensis TaxID=318465 RepID=A0ABU4GQT0_9CLOT|nr:DUF1538 domain-containing protein [Clostridium boliviensis]MDW2799997.1 DUF1538 domain-containing protein [Clostridium boliviensis]
MNQKLKEKIIESLSSVLPVTCIVLLLCITITPMPLDPLMLFLVGAALLIVGMGFFTLGVDMSMMIIGEKAGNHLAKSKKIPLIISACFLIGFIITIAEPDLQVLAGQTPAFPDLVLIIFVAAGVGLFLALAFLRTLFEWNLSRLLLICYGILFIMVFFVPKDFLAVAFDSGGVTTGPITVPFIMALGVGLSSIGRSSKNSGSDSFGLVALCSIGPILSVMILGIFYGSSASSYEPAVIPAISNSQDLWLAFQHEFPDYAKEVFLALFPVFGFFAIFQIFLLKLRRRQVIKILMGMLYSYLGLTLFLTGVNVGFMPAGNYLGKQLASLTYNWIMVPIGMLIGYYIVKAEPAVLVLNKQVEEVTGGAISQKTMMTGLSMGMAISLGLSVIRILTGLPLLAVLIPGYALALGLSFVVPPIFTSIAFDSGGVASGPMTATFLLPFAMGACEATGKNIVTDAFGIVAMIAMTPLITIQLIGVIYYFKTKRSNSFIDTPAIDMELEFIELGKEEADDFQS